MYILAAVLLCIAIFGIIKVTNRLELPADTNFDFYVENFKGERAYVYDLGFLQGDATGDIVGGGGLLDIFAEFGTGTGIVFIEYDNRWTITNYLGQDIVIEDEVLPSGTLPVMVLSFDIGKKYNIKMSDLNELEKGSKYFRKSFSDMEELVIDISGNNYKFIRPSEGDKIESIVFQNVDKDYVKVVQI